MKESNPKHSLEDHDFGELAKTESKARARTRLYILHQYRIGKQSFEIAENLSINIETVRRTRRRYQAFGCLVLSVCRHPVLLGCQQSVV